jgi:hypothetical protein
MTRFRVLTMRSRSDQNREIESRDDNVSVRSLAQSRKETEFSELRDGYFALAIRVRLRRCRDADIARTVACSDRRRETWSLRDCWRECSATRHLVRRVWQSKCSCPHANREARWSMPEKETLERARRDRAQGKSSSTQAGEFVREEIHHGREGKHGAESTKQAIAIGLSN